jgi:hypothetical protein
MSKPVTVKTFPPSPLCAECGGKCCQAAPGCLLPCDLPPGDMLAGIVALLRTGRYAVDWWECGVRRGSTENAPFLRPAVYGQEKLVRDPAWGGRCTFFKKGLGCGLPLKRRPSGCRALEPKSHDTCAYGFESKYVNEKHFAAVAWWPHHKILWRAADEVESERVKP